MLSRLIKRIRTKFGIKSVVIRRADPIEWTNRDSKVLRSFLCQTTGLKLKAVMDDLIVCAISDLKEKEFCHGMLALREYIYTLEGEEEAIDPHDLFDDADEYTTLQEEPLPYPDN